MQPLSISATPTSSGHHLPPAISPEHHPHALSILHHVDALHRHHATQKENKFWWINLCGGLAVGLFPYTPGLVENCQASHNAGWLCGARICTFIAASGAVVIGALAGVSLHGQKSALASQVEQLGIDLGHITGEPDAASALVAAYHIGNTSDRQGIRNQLKRPSPPV